MLNSLHCLLLFWEAQESRQPTRQGEQKTLDKSYQYKFKENPLYTLSYVSYMSLRLG